MTFGVPNNFAASLQFELLDVAHPITGVHPSRCECRYIRRRKPLPTLLSSARDEHHRTTPVGCIIQSNISRSEWVMPQSKRSAIPTVPNLLPFGLAPPQNAQGEGANPIHAQLFASRQRNGPPDLVCASHNSRQFGVPICQEQEHELGVANTAIRKFP